MKWADMNRSWKLGFVDGWIQGGEIGSKETIFVIMLRDIEIHIEKKKAGVVWEIPGGPGGEGKDKYLEIASDIAKEKGFKLHDLPFNQIIDTIDNVYSDPRVKTWEIFEIMPLVRGRLKEGWTEKELDEVISYKVKEKELDRKMSFSYSSESEKLKLAEEREALLDNMPKVLYALKAYLNKLWTEAR